MPTLFQGETRNTVAWQAIDAAPGEIAVAHAGTRKKFAGMKQFEAYEIGQVLSFLQQSSTA